MQNWGDIWSLGTNGTNSENLNAASANTNTASANSNVNVGDPPLTATPPLEPQTLPLFDIDSLTSVRLPGFWRRSPQRWFTHVEALFHSHCVRSDLSRVNHVLTSLDEDGIRAVEDLFGIDVKYSADRRVNFDTGNTKSNISQSGEITIKIT